MHTDAVRQISGAVRYRCWADLQWPRLVPLLEEDFRREKAEEKARRREKDYPFFSRPHTVELKLKLWPCCAQGCSHHPQRTSSQPRPPERIRAELQYVRRYDYHHCDLLHPQEAVWILPFVRLHPQSGQASAANHSLKGIKTCSKIFQLIQMFCGAWPSPSPQLPVTPLTYWAIFRHGIHNIAGFIYLLN